SDQRADEDDVNRTTNDPSRHDPVEHARAHIFFGHLDPADDRGALGRFTVVLDRFQFGVRCHGGPPKVRTSSTAAQIDSGTGFAGLSAPGLFSKVTICCRRSRVFERICRSPRRNHTAMLIAINNNTPRPIAIPINMVGLYVSSTGSGGRTAKVRP